MNRQTIAIKQDNLLDGNIVRLLKEHMTDMLKHSPPESVHALNPEALRHPDITFWSARLTLATDVGDDLTQTDAGSFSESGQFAGCVALKNLRQGDAELKSMKTELAHLRKGVADALLCHVIAEAKSQGYRDLYLETGTPAVFEPAIKLYRKYGFDVCGPFADYGPDPLSLFMRLDLSA